MHAAENPNTLLLGGGDLIGASPLISALFHEESTIEAMNLMGMDFSTVGNHEFDKGYMELLRLQQGGAHPDGDADGDPYYGADFQYLSSNIFIDSTGKRLFPAYKVVNFNGVRVGLIASTYEATPSIVTPAGVAGLRFAPEIAQINAAAKILKRMKVKTMVVLIHNGGAVPGTTYYNDCA
jgi:5'-nucleotidase